MKKKKFTSACVTGGAGFIGSHLVEALLHKGMRVHVLDNLSVGRKEHVPSGAHLFVGDILNQDDTDAAIKGCDVVFHLAARVAIRSSFEFAVEDTMTNVVGTANVLKSSVNAGTVSSFINTSSMAVYADADSPSPVDEQHRLMPISPYGISKLAAEQLTRTICTPSGINNVSLRLFNTYGPGQEYSPYVGVVTIFVNQLKKNESPAIFGDGEQCRDFIHVQDVVSGFVKAMENAREADGEVFNIGTGAPTTINAVFNAVRSAMNSSLATRHVAAVEGELRYSIADITKARTMLGYEPEYMFEPSIQAVIEEILWTQ